MKELTAHINQMEKYALILIAAMIGMVGAIIKAIHQRSGLVRGVLDGLVAFILCGAASALMIHYASWPEEIVGGASGVLGMYSQRISKWIETLTDAIGARIKQYIETFDTK